MVCTAAGLYFKELSLIIKSGDLSSDTFNAIPSATKKYWEVYGYEKIEKPFKNVLVRSMRTAKNPSKMF